MGFYSKLALVVGVVIAVLFWLQSRPDPSPGPRPSGTQSATTPPPVPLLTASPTIIPAATQVPISEPPAALVEAAKKSQVTISKIQRNGADVVVTVQAFDRNHIGDFMDECIKAGMKDIDMNRGNYRQGTTNGRTVFQDTLKMRF